jgi:hypothetical protein
MYESFYLRAVDPRAPRGVWIRYTVHKRPDARPRGSLWCTYFDAARPRPFMQKLTSDELAVPADGWIAIAGESELGPAGAQGACGGARWSLAISAPQAPLRHLPRAWMYRAPLPRTKLTSPAPAARFDGELQLPPAAGEETGGETVRLEGWRGMLGHNWGAEHAERWIWLHALCLRERPARGAPAAGVTPSAPVPETATGETAGIGAGADAGAETASADTAWLDVAIGRVRVAGRTTPWVANGALALDGERLRLGGLGARGLLVAERPTHCRLTLPGAAGLRVEAHVQAPAEALAGWRYADPDGGEHEVGNCSIASLALTLHRPGRVARTLSTDHGAAYELGMREHDHGVPLAPFADG